MEKLRFFATLHTARKLTSPDKILKDLLIRAFYVGYTRGWKENNKGVSTYAGNQ